MAVTVTARGPLFDRGAQAIEEIGHRIAVSVAEEGKTTVLFGLNHTLRNPSPSGGYRSMITATPMRRMFARVHDNNAVYGPWLEGTGSRNATTRFKGYANFRKSTQELDRRAGDIARKVIADNIELLGGS